MRVLRNCDGEHPCDTLEFPWAYPIELKRCPFSVIPNEAWQYVDVWRQFKALDILPEPGPVGAQPAHVFQAIMACEDALTQAEARARRRAEAEQKRQAAMIEQQKRGGRR